MEVVGLEYRNKFGTGSTSSEEIRFILWRANQLLNTSYVETRVIPIAIGDELTKNGFAVHCLYHSAILYSAILIGFEPIL